MESRYLLILAIACLSLFLGFIITRNDGFMTLLFAMGMTFLFAGLGKKKP